METKRETNRKAQELRELRELKLERILLYSKWEKRPPEEKHLDWKHWMLLRKLRKETENYRYYKNKSDDLSYDNSEYVYTFFGAKIEKVWWKSNEEFDNYITRLNREYVKLQKYDTKPLLYKYMNKYNNNYSMCVCEYYSEILLEGECYLTESFKYVLDTREHIERKKKKKNFQGKKDKKHGRKNPTKRR